MFGVGLDARRYFLGKPTYMEELPARLDSVSACLDIR